MFNLICKNLFCLLVLIPGTLGAQALPVPSVPFGDQIDGRVFNYNRLRTDIATSGQLGEGAAQLLANKGFKTILDLRTKPEGTEKEASEVERAGIRYINVPIGRELPGSEEVTQLRKILADPGRGPLLVHCASANRVGVLWALYQVDNKVPLETALAEGRAIGMSTEREQQIRESIRN